jgi:hypothetical protein
MFIALMIIFIASSRACEVWMIECYKYSAPLALRREDIDSNDLLFAHSSNNNNDSLGIRIGSSRSQLIYIRANSQSAFPHQDFRYA